VVAQALLVLLPRVVPQRRERGREVPPAVRERRGADVCGLHQLRQHGGPLAAAQAVQH
jgi:hypothetical protein